jgi:hypothetical protein
MEKKQHEADEALESISYAMKEADDNKREAEKL